MCKNAIVQVSDAKQPRPCTTGLTAGREPLAAWRSYSRRARAILSIAAALKSGKMGDVADWQTMTITSAEETDRDRGRAAEERRFGPPFWYHSIPTLPTPVEGARILISAEIERWLTFWRPHRRIGFSDFTLQWRRDHGRFELQINYNGFLFAAITLQLALIVVEADSLYLCSGCGIPYARARERKRPKAGWSNYCEICSRLGVAQRHAVERYRKRRANMETKKGESNGNVPSNIHRQENRPTARVCGLVVRIRLCRPSLPGIREEHQKVAGG